MHRFQHFFAVLDAMIGLFFRPDISTETLWVGGWLLRLLLPYSVEDSSRYHPELLKVRRTVILMLYFELHKNYINCRLGEVTEIWCDVLIAVIIDAWKKYKRAYNRQQASEVVTFVHPSIDFTFQQHCQDLPLWKGEIKCSGRWEMHPCFQGRRCCKSAESMILEEMNLQSTAVKKRLCPLLNLKRPVNDFDASNLAT